MTDLEKIQLKFYQNGSAEAVLSRFEFSEDEEKLVRSAIQTSKMKKPRMQLIYKVDELLKTVAKTRTPIVKKTTTKEPMLVVGSWATDENFEEVSRKLRERKLKS